MNKRLFLITVGVLIMSCAAMAQTRDAVQINEVMVQNTPDGYTDEYGQHPAWIELFNSNFAPIDISRIYITVNKVKYPVPMGDAMTKVGKRQHIVFFADNQPARGTFHTNFCFDPSKENVIEIYDTDGEKLIDSVTVPVLQAGQSYARCIDGDDKWEIRDNTGNKYITPSSANLINDTNDKINKFRTHDKHGFSMTLMAMSIVFSALLVLCVCFYFIGKLNERTSKVKKVKSTGVETVSLKEVSHDTGEEIAAIVMALHEHFDTHDRENTILTINKVKKAYSPWSSKIYGLRITPEHHPSRR